MKKKNLDNLKDRLYDKYYLDVVFYLLSLWLIFFPYPYLLIIIIVLLIPIIEIIINGLSKEGFHRIFLDDSDDKIVKAISIKTPVLALLVRVILDYNIVEYSQSIVPSIIVFSIIIIIIGFTNKMRFKFSKRNLKIYSLFVLHYLIYAWSFTIIVNCLFDASKPTLTKSKIMNKDLIRGRKYTIPEIITEKNERIKVVGSDYKNMNAEDEVLIYNFNGLFGIKWRSYQTQTPYTIIK